MAISHPDKINAALDEKVTAFREFLSVTSLLKKMIENEDISMVNHLIRRRDELAGIIDNLDHRTAFYQNTVSSCRSPVIAGQRSAIFKEIREILRLIISENQECKNLAAHRADELKEKVKLIDQQKKMFHGYRGHTQIPSKFLSVKT